MKTVIVLLIAMTLHMPALAQAQKSPVAGGVVVASEPGKAVIAEVAEITATVVAIHKASRTVTLRGPQGNSVNIVAGPEVRNFEQIRVGDRVVVQYQQALSLELRKARTSGEPTETVVTARAAPGERPAGAIGREINALVDVVAVDPKKSTITLKGPQGNVIELKVQNQDQFKVVKKGDQVEVVYSEAFALAVTPAPKAAAKK
ncbi:MAG: hypothetical protein ACRET7_00955 [Burkholderiales bacterium]